MGHHHARALEECPKRIESDPQYCAYWFGLWCRRNTRRLRDIGRELNCDIDTVLQLATCFAPRTLQVHRDLLIMAKRHRVQVFGLACVLMLCDPFYQPVKDA